MFGYPSMAAPPNTPVPPAALFSGVVCTLRAVNPSVPLGPKAKSVVRGGGAKVG
jgi:hypothetical protein